MIGLIVSIIFILLALFLNSFIRKYNIFLYLGMIVLSIISFWQIEQTIVTPFRLGLTGLGIFFVVMLTGALKDKSKLRIALMKVRMEYSILGFIAVTPHAIYQFLRFLDTEISIPILGIIAFVIMIPLFITSFKIIRKKMSYKAWKNLQLLAYLVYIALFVHLILQARMPNLVIYIVEFAVYLVLKIYYEIKKCQKKSKNITKKP